MENPWKRKASVRCSYLPAPGEGDQSPLEDEEGPGGVRHVPEEVLEALGIEEEWLERYPRELSGGELQRFCVARSLFEGTHFLLADEMSTMLDVITQAQIWNLMLREVEKRKIGLLAVTHNMALADCVCTRTINLAQVNHIKCAEESGCKNGCEYGTV